MSTDYTVESEKNIYDLLNDMEQDLSGYEAQPASKEDLKKWRNAFNRSRGVEYVAKKNRMKNVIAASFVLYIVVLGVFSSEVYAELEKISFTVQELVGTTSYTPSTVINKTIRKHGCEITISDAVVDENSIYLAYTVSEPIKDKDVNKDIDEFDSEDYPFVDVKVKINGKVVDQGSSSTCFDFQKTDTEIIQMYFVEFYLDTSDLSKEQKIDFEFAEENSMSKKYGSVSITVSSEDMVNLANVCEIDQTLVLDDGSKIQLNKYRATPIVQRIYGTIIPGESGNSHYDIILRGTDNLGRSVEFYKQSQNKDKITFEVLYDEDSYNKDSINNTADMSKVNSFTLTAYAQEYSGEGGCMDADEEKQIGEPFTINLQFEQK